jgi:hypothetical protein
MISWPPAPHFLGIEVPATVQPEGRGSENLVVWFVPLPGFQQMLLQFQFRVSAPLAQGWQLPGCRASGLGDVPVPRFARGGVDRLRFMLGVHNRMVARLGAPGQSIEASPTAHTLVKGRRRMGGAPWLGRRRRLTKTLCRDIRSALECRVPVFLRGFVRDMSRNHHGEPVQPPAEPPASQWQNGPHRFTAAASSARSR